MTSIIKLHAISGAMDESPPCYILQVDELRILLDCGWDENFNDEFMRELKRSEPSITIRLLDRNEEFNFQTRSSNRRGAAFISGSFTFGRFTLPRW